MISYAGYIICSGTVPGGSRGTGNNGQLYDAGVSVDYGSSISVTTPDDTALLYATTTRSYQGGWRSDTQDVIQGVYSDSGYNSSLSWNYGCMWFEKLQYLLSGTTIKSATLTLSRKAGSGSGSTKTLYYQHIFQRLSHYRSELWCDWQHWAWGNSNFFHSSSCGAGTGQRPLWRAMSV